MGTLIETDRLIIRNFTSADFFDFCEYFCDESLSGLMAGHVYSDEASARLLFNANIQDKYSYAIELKSEKKVIGEVHFANIITLYLAHIGFVINKDYRQNGYCTEAVTALIKHAFNSLGFGRIRGICHLKNTASQKLLEACGFKCEALIYDGDFGGAVADIYYYSICFTDI